MGMLIYPFIILLASVLGFDKAASLITDIASVYVIAASGVVAAFMGFNAYSAKAESKKTSIQMEEKITEKTRSTKLIDSGQRHCPIM
jgi:flagellar motor component MotA